MNMDLEQTKILMQAGVDALIAFAPKLAIAVLILIIGRIIAGRVGTLVEAGLYRAKMDKTLSVFGGNMARYFIFMVAGLALLNNFGIETTSFVAVLGALGFAVGLALQGSLSNFSSGVMLLFFRPFSVGDVIEAGGVVGGVKALGIFSTTLATPDNVFITVPNSQIYGGVIKNMTNQEKRRVDIGVGVEYGAEPDKAKKVLLDMLKALPEVLDDPGNDVYLISLGASSVDFQMRAWCKPSDYWTVREKLQRGAWYALAEAGIGIPYQTIDLNIVSQPGSGE